MLDVSKVLVGAPDQLTTGAIYDAPVGTALPTSATDALADGFTSSGYISDDGLGLTPNRSTTDINDWSANKVRTILESFNATITWSEMQMSYESLCHAFGAENVKKVAANGTHGAQVNVEVGAEMPEARSWVFRMKDGAARILIVVPNGQVTSVDEISFVANDAIKLPLTLSCNADENGKYVYIYTDDGKVVSA